MRRSPPGAGLSGSLRSFSLTEVLLAIGIISFALIPLIGLLSVPLSMNRESGEATALAAIGNYVATDIRSRPFTNASSMASNPVPAYFFDNQGRFLEYSAAGTVSATNRAGTLYRASTIRAQTNLGMIAYQILVCWPFPSLRFSNSVAASIPGR